MHMLFWRDCDGKLRSIAENRRLYCGVSSINFDILVSAAGSLDKIVKTGNEITAVFISLSLGLGVMFTGFSFTYTMESGINRISTAEAAAIRIWWH